MDRRWFLATLGCVGVAGSITGRVDARRSDSPTSNDGWPTGRLFDTRAGVSDRFSLTEGLTTLDVTYPADSTISLDLIGDEISDGRRLLVDDTGQEAGTVFQIEEGTYRIAVSTSGPWEIEWTQPTAGDSETNDVGGEPTLPPQQTSGTGPGHTGPVLLARTTELTVEHTGTGPIAVTAYTPTGHRQRLIEAHGDTEEWTTTDIAGAGWFDIAASGEWTLEVF